MESQKLIHLKEQYRIILTILFAFGLAHASLVAQTGAAFERYDGCSTIKRYHALKAGVLDVPQTHLLFDYDVHFYHLDLNVDKDTTYLSGNVLVAADVVAAQLDTFALEFIETMTIDSVVFNGNSQEFFRINDECFMPLEIPVDSGETFGCRVYFRGTPPGGSFFNGVSQYYDSTWNQSVVWTLSEPFNARQWWPTKQVLDDKADSVWVFLTTDSDSKAGSIGLLEHVVPLPDSRIRYEWKSRYPIAYYLISYAVADYQEYNIYGKPVGMNGDSILIQNYIYNSPGCLEHYKSGIDRTAPMMELFSDLYSLYPFAEEKYGHCLAGLSGGMEHQTMTTLGYFGLGIVAHELAHMWFGDNVTCATWSDIWVNEGFATYSDYLAHEKLADPQWAPIWLDNALNYILSEPDGSVYVPSDAVYYGNESRIFSSRLTYYKGAYLLHMIRYRIGNDSIFFEALRNYQAHYKDLTATSEDFIDILNQTTGLDFTDFFDQWFYGEGFPILNIDWWMDGEVFHFTSAQTASAPIATPFFNVAFPVKVFFSDGTDTVIEIDHTQPFAEIAVNTSTGVDSIQVDPDLWILKKVASINSIWGSAVDWEIGLWPNPASEEIFVQSGITGSYSARIYDNQGKLISIFAVSEPDHIFDIRSLFPGIYFLELTTNDKKTVKKFVKH